MPAPAVAAYVPTYATETPYLTVQEFLTAQTGVDTSQLVPGGTKADNAAALAELILQASSVANDFCRQVLAATSDVQVGEYRVFPDGTIRVWVAYTPLIIVSGVKVGAVAGQLAALTDLSGLWIREKAVRIPTAGLARAAAALGAATAGPGYLFAEVTYINGFANTVLAAATAAGDSSVAVRSPLGIVPGLSLGIYSGANSEQITVAPSYTIGSTTVPLVAPMTYAHDPSTVDGQQIAVSALPGAIRRAVIALTAYLIKTRGAESVALVSVMQQPTKTQKIEPDGDEDLAIATRLLQPFQRVA
jgi:hypothetical protein